MDTCSTCEEFCATTETCNCPLNAYPNVFTEEYVYAKTAADNNACMFYMKVIVIKKED